MTLTRKQCASLRRADGNIHVMPTEGSMEHIESKECWCEPTLIQAIDDEHDKEVWSHKGYEELDQ